MLLENSDSVSVCPGVYVFYTRLCRMWVVFLVLAVKNGADGDGSCMDWDGDTSDENSGDDCSDDEVNPRDGHPPGGGKPGYIIAVFGNPGRGVLLFSRLSTKIGGFGGPVHPFKLFVPFGGETS